MPSVAQRPPDGLRAFRRHRKQGRNRNPACHRVHWSGFSICMPQIPESDGRIAPRKVLLGHSGETEAPEQTRKCPSPRPNQPQHQTSRGCVVGAAHAGLHDGMWTVNSSKFDIRQPGLPYCSHSYLGMIMEGISRAARLYCFLLHFLGPSRILRDCSGVSDSLSDTVHNRPLTPTRLLVFFIPSQPPMSIPPQGTTVPPHPGGEQSPSDGSPPGEGRTVHHSRPANSSITKLKVFFSAFVACDFLLISYCSWAKVTVPPLRGGWTRRGDEHGGGGRCNRPENELFKISASREVSKIVICLAPPFGHKKLQTILATKGPKSRPLTEEPLFQRPTGSGGAEYNPPPIGGVSPAKPQVLKRSETVTCSATCAHGCSCTYMLVLCASRTLRRRHPFGRPHQDSWEPQSKKKATPSLPCRVTALLGCCHQLHLYLLIFPHRPE